MTAIAAMARGRHVWMAGDSALTGDDDDCALVFCADPKVWTIGPYVMGAAGDAGTDRALCSLTWDPSPRWLQEQACAQLRNACAKEKAEDISALIGIRGELYEFDGQALMRLADRVACVGVAADLCLGFMFGSRLEPRERVRAAVRLATQRVVGCGGRIRVVSV